MYFLSDDHLALAAQPQVSEGTKEPDIASLHYVIRVGGGILTFFCGETLEKSGLPVME